MKSKKAKGFEKSVFKDTKEYTEFAIKHKVFGVDAVNLKKRMDKLNIRN